MILLQNCVDVKIRPSNSHNTIACHTILAPFTGSPGEEQISNVVYTINWKPTAESRFPDNYLEALCSHCLFQGVNSQQNISGIQWKALFW